LITKIDLWILKKLLAFMVSIFFSQQLTFNIGKLIAKPIFHGAEFSVPLCILIENLA